MIMEALLTAEVGAFLTGIEVSALLLLSVAVLLPLSKGEGVRKMLNSN